MCNGSCSRGFALYRLYCHVYMLYWRRIASSYFRIVQVDNVPATLTKSRLWHCQCRRSVLGAAAVCVVSFRPGFPDQNRPREGVACVGRPAAGGVLRSGHVRAPVRSVAIVVIGVATQATSTTTRAKAVLAVPRHTHKLGLAVSMRLSSFVCQWARQ